MATVVRKSGSPYWHAAFRAGGKQYRRSTKETVRNKAQKLADLWESIAQRRLKPSHVRETTNRLIQDHYPDEVPFSTAREYITRWLEVKRPEVAERTMESYQKSAELFLRYLGPAADQDISTLRKQIVAQYRNERLRHVSATTTNMDLAFVKRILASAKREGYLSDNPAEAIEPAKTTNVDVRRPFTIGELKVLLEVATPEWQSLIKFGLYTGQRLGDLAALTWASIDLERGTITFKPRKTGRVAVIPIAEPLRAHILILRSGDNPRAPLHPRAAKMAVNRLSPEFGDLLTNVGLREIRKPAGRGPGGRREAHELSFHCLRWTCNTLLKEAGIPQAVVMELIGHQTSSMSAHYTAVGIEALRKAAAALPEI